MPTCSPFPIAVVPSPYSPTRHPILDSLLCARYKDVATVAHNKAAGFPSPYSRIQYSFLRLFRLKFYCPFHHFETRFAYVEYGMKTSHSPFPVSHSPHVEYGKRFHPGKNVGLGKDYTIYSLIDGFVKFEKYGADKRKVSLYPKEILPENPDSHIVRMREYSQ